LNAGALIRNFWMVIGLARRYDVDVVIAERSLLPPSPEFAAACASIAQFDAPHGFLGRVRRAVASLAPGESFFTAGQVPSALIRHVQRAVEEIDYAAIHVDDLPIRCALPMRNCPPVVYASHNCEYALFHRRAEIETGPLRALALFDAERVRRIESALAGRAELITACSEDDIRDLVEFCGMDARHAVVVPNGVDVARYAEVVGRESDTSTILISGSMDWRPNQQGLRWFMAEVLPKLSQAVEDGVASVRVAGRMNDELVRELAAYPGVTPSPNPADMRDELARARIVVAPILASSGTRLRILEAWAAGRPVVTTPAGAFGLEYSDGDELLCAQEPAAFAEAIVRILKDASLWEHVRQCATARVAQYDWRRICDVIESSHTAAL
jgi:glycosyltransferase involved in cell wall biosynthesis